MSPRLGEGACLDTEQITRRRWQGFQISGRSYVQGELYPLTAQLQPQAVQQRGEMLTVGIVFKTGERFSGEFTEMGQIWTYGLLSCPQRMCYLIVEGGLWSQSLFFCPWASNSMLGLKVVKSGFIRLVILSCVILGRGVGVLHLLTGVNGKSLQKAENEQLTTSLLICEC